MARNGLISTPLLLTPKMTNEYNATRQRVWQKKRRAQNLIAFRWIMAKVQGSQKGLRFIQTMLRRVGRNKDSTPAQVLSAAKWLLYIETGKRIPSEADLPSPTSYPPPLKPSEVEQNSVVNNPVVSPDDDDSDVVAMANKLKA